MSLRCAGCKKKISGAYIQALDKHWHSQCLKCVGCGKPFESHVFSDAAGQPWHQQCHLEKHGKKCAACGDWIRGGESVLAGKAYHPSCLCCGGCGKALKDKKVLIKDGSPFHDACYHQRFTKPCAVCGVPLVKKHVIDGWGNAYCSKHVKREPSCLSCGRLISKGITGGGVRYGDGHTLCNLCLKTAVRSQDQAEHAFGVVRAEFEKMGFELNGQATPIRLVSGKEFKKYGKRKRGSRPVLGMARKQIVTQGKRVVKREFLEIIIQQGLPKEHFDVVAIHELCHAWLFIKGFGDLPLKLEEGLCCLLEYLWLNRLDTPEAAYRKRSLLENQDKIYGDGFRAALKAVQKHDLAHVFNHVRSHKRLPGGMFSGLFG